MLGTYSVGAIINRVGFLVHKILEKNVVEFNSVSERETIKRKSNNKSCTISTTERLFVNVPACSHRDEKLQGFYDVH